MVQAQVDSNVQRLSTVSTRKNRGYSMVELIMTMLVGSILTAVAIPQVKTQMYGYRITSAVAMAKWAIQSTRFQALMKGYPYQVVFTASTQTYQIQNLPSGTTYQNVGGVVPLSAWPMTMNNDQTVNFRPNGMVTTTATSFSLTYQGSTKQVTVSNYGNVTVQ